MIPWLDLRIFGDGHGMAQPHFDGRFYWLVDTLRKDRAGKNGEFYHWSGWFGAQLVSYQWRHPIAGERRKLAGEEFVVFSSTRKGLRVAVSWALCNLPKDTGAANARLRDLQMKLGEYHG